MSRPAHCAPALSLVLQPSPDDPARIHLQGRWAEVPGYRDRQNGNDRDGDNDDQGRAF